VIPSHCRGCDGSLPPAGDHCPRCRTLSHDISTSADDATTLRRLVPHLATPTTPWPAEPHAQPSLPWPPATLRAHPPPSWMPPVPAALPPWGDGPPATFGQRLGARLLDTLVVMGLTAALWTTLVTSVLAFGSASGALIALLLGPLLIMVMNAVVTLLYFQLSEAAGGRTVGRSAMGIRLVNTDMSPARTDRVGGWQAIGRRIIQGLGDCVFLLGSLSMLWSPDRRTWADKAGNTAVIQSRSAPGPGRSVKASLLATAISCAVIVTGIGAASALAPSMDDDSAASGTSGESSDATDSGDEATPDAPLSVEIDPSASRQVAVSAEVPAQSPEGHDNARNTTSYDPANLFDDDATTAWRMDGDGTGSIIVIRLDQARTLTSVGVINGYAKTDPQNGEDRYLQERRVTSITWSFDDGTEVQQTLTDTTELQQLDLPSHPSTATVTFRIDATSGDGEFDPNHDFTALSEVAVEGQ
jgi:uncharacterized RDD family membrane protein YckC